jgi:hypothetical protein
MNERINNKNLFNLVLFELEKYANNARNNPLISDESHYAELRTKKAPLHRAIHWHLLDNGLIYPSKNLRLGAKKEEYENIWIIKNFNKSEVCQKIIEEYGEYLHNFLDDFEELFFRIDSGIEKELRRNGLSNELNNAFEQLNKKYSGNAEIVISEYNKLMLKKYAEIIFKKN